MTDLQSVIPNFAGVKNFEDIQSRFIRSARSIMCSHKLVYGEGESERCWEITALELYLRLNKQPLIWMDPATDKDDEQLNRDSWYVRQKKGPGYWRIDITAGSKESDIHAGLLIRQLNRKSGPTHALHTIIRGFFDRSRWPDEERDRIEQIHGTSIFSGPLKLVGRQTATVEKLWHGPRIGLNKYDEVIRKAKLRLSTWKMDEDMTEVWCE